ncbi:MAG: hypothetical protein AAFZ92_00300 [Pseudomonadota bacterium]
MTFELSHIALIGISYLFILFGIAYAASSGWIPKSITNHPVTYVLSLGIFFSAWSFYGVIDLAYEFGYGALAYYMGTGAFFLFAPIIQAPLAELCRRFQLRPQQTYWFFVTTASWRAAWRLFFYYCR